MDGGVSSPPVPKPRTKIFSAPKETQINTDCGASTAKESPLTGDGLSAAANFATATSTTSPSVTPFPESPSAEMVMKRLHQSIYPQLDTIEPFSNIPNEPNGSISSSSSCFLGVSTSNSASIRPEKPPRADRVVAHGDVVNDGNLSDAKPPTSSHSNIVHSPPIRKAPLPPRPPPPEKRIEAAQRATSVIPSDNLPAEHKNAILPPPIPARNSSSSAPGKVVSSVSPSTTDTSDRSSTFSTPHSQKSSSVSPKSNNSQKIDRYQPIFTKAESFNENLAIENPIYMDLASFRSYSDSVSPNNFSTSPCTPKNTPGSTISLTSKETTKSCDSGLADPSESELSPPLSLLSLSKNQDPPVTSRPSLLDDRFPRPSHSNHQVPLNAYTPSPKRSDFTSSGMSFSPEYVNTNHGHSNAETTNVSNNTNNLANLFSSRASNDYVDASFMAKHHSRHSNRDCKSDSSEDGRDGVVADGSTVAFFGFVQVNQGRNKRRLHARLREMKLSFHENDEAEDCAIGPFELSRCDLIRIVQKSQSEDPPVSKLSMESPPSNDEVHAYFERKKVVFRPEDEVWIEFITQAWMSQVPQMRDIEGKVILCGRSFLKEGSTIPEFENVSLVICDQTMYYASPMKLNEIKELDIRQVVSIQEKVDKQNWCSKVKHKPLHARGAFMIVAIRCSLLLECADDDMTSAFFDTFSRVLNAPVSSLNKFRCTSDNVPVFVEKCIAFVSEHGKRAEGIYRRNGRQSEMRELREKLYSDPTGTFIERRDDETVYAVADILRLFFRKLDEPLIPRDCQTRLFEAYNKCCSGTASYDVYTEILSESLSLVHYRTLRKVLGHLKSINSHVKENKASVENLAKVFSASLFQTESDESEHCFSSPNLRIGLLVHLIEHYPTVFCVTEIEEIKEKRMDLAGEKVTQNNFQRTDGLLVPIQIQQNDSIFNCNASLVADEAIKMTMASRLFTSSRDKKFALFESVRNGALLRRLKSWEKLSSVVVDRWLAWDCKDGKILFDHDNEPFDSDVMCEHTNKVKVAEPGSKSFKSYVFRFDPQDEKDGQKMVISAWRNEKKWKSWNADDTVWFVGAEPSRKAPYTFNMTMIPKVCDVSTARLPGFCVSFATNHERIQWTNSVAFLHSGCKPDPLVHI